MKIGPGATPFETDRGWLHIYHGVFPTQRPGESVPEEAKTASLR